MRTHNICEAILMSTHNICFYGELTKIILKLSSNTLLICSTDQADMSLSCLTVGFAMPSLTWQDLFIPYANKKDADQPGHSHSYISTFVVCCLDRIILTIAKSEFQDSSWSLSLSEQAGSSLNWLQSR